MPNDFTEEDAQDWARRRAGSEGASDEPGVSDAGLDSPDEGDDEEGVDVEQVGPVEALRGVSAALAALEAAELPEGLDAKVVKAFEDARKEVEDLSDDLDSAADDLEEAIEAKAEEDEEAAKDAEDDEAEGDDEADDEPEGDEE